MTAEREARLPKWAQQELADARRKIDRLQQVLDDEAAETGVQFSLGALIRPMPSYAHVTFEVGHDGEDRITLYAEDDRVHGTVLRVRAEPSGRIAFMGAGGVNVGLLTVVDW